MQRRVAIVGAGPAGLFAAQALVAHADADVRVDLIERLPTPYGLLRYGVAPDHESIRSVARTLAKVLDDARVDFWGMVEVGRDVTRTQLLEAYDAVVYAVGAAADVRLGIPGEDLAGSRSAREFVAWYGGHPDAIPQRLDGVRGVATVGVGNVAVDVARILLKTADSLRVTDMPDAVLDELAGSEVDDVWVIGRRGPQHASYTTKELRELIATPGVVATVSSGAFDGIDVDALDRRTRANVEALQALPTEVPAGTPGRRLHFQFWARPVAMCEQNGRVDGVTLEHTRLSPEGRVEGTGETWPIDVQLVLRAVGYRGTPLPDVPFDATRAIIPNVGGRVLDADGVVAPREYCTGWAKRGPIGVIGTNKPDAAETAAAVLADLAAAPPGPERTGIGPVLREAGHRPTTLADWRAIDAAEVELGRLDGRERVKLATWDELLAAVGREQSRENDDSTR